MMVYYTHHITGQDFIPNIYHQQPGFVHCSSVRVSTTNMKQQHLPKLLENGEKAGEGLISWGGGGGIAGVLLGFHDEISGQIFIKIHLHEAPPKK